MPTAIARTLHLRETGARPIEVALREHLRYRHMVLVLDNFEQVTAAASFMAALLETARRLTVLVTSRSLLHVRGEHEFQVTPLEVPRLGDVPLADIEQSSAVALFLLQMRMRRPTFALTAEMARRVVEVCDLVDGRPLGIELAAAHSTLLSPARSAGAAEVRPVGLALVGRARRAGPAS